MLHGFDLDVTFSGAVKLASSILQQNSFHFMNERYSVSLCLYVYGGTLGGTWYLLLIVHALYSKSQNIWVVPRTL